MYERNLRRHMQDIHSIKQEDRKPIKKEPGVQTFQCDQCPYKTTYKGNFREHRESVHQIGEKLKCEQCPYESYRRGCLKRHTQAVHDKVKKHNCEACDTSFFEKAILRKHIMRVHEKVKRHLCEH